ncbi:hypothetical protein [Komagataeibacter xylinus]
MRCSACARARRPVPLRHRQRPETGIPTLNYGVNMALTRMTSSVPRDSTG